MPKAGLMVDWMGTPRVLALHLTKPASISNRKDQDLHLVRLATVADHIKTLMDLNKGAAGTDEEVWKRPASTNWQPPQHASSASPSGSTV